MIHVTLKIFIVGLVLMRTINARATIITTIHDINKHGVRGARNSLSSFNQHNHNHYEIRDNPNERYQCSCDAENETRRMNDIAGKLFLNRIRHKKRNRENDDKMPSALLFTTGNTVAGNNRFSGFNGDDATQMVAEAEVQRMELNDFKKRNSSETPVTNDGSAFLKKSFNSMKQYRYGRNQRLRRNIQQQNLCEGDCVCNQKNNFLTVECNFSQNRMYILGHTKYIPKQATSLIIKIAPNGQLRLDEYLFYQNNINKILIESVPHGKSHVEFSPRSMFGNNGPFPEIDIINCHTVVLRSNAFNEIAGEYKLNITNCIEVMIFPEAFFNTTFHGYLENIADLHILEKGLISHDQTKIEINKCNIDQLNRLDAPLKEIKFIHSTINKITTGAFDVLSINSIVFDHCTIGIIETKATTERLYSGYFAITESTIETIESEAIDKSGIIKVLMQNNSIKAIEENAIKITAVTVLMTNNSINHLGQNWFRVQDWQNITIFNNKFGDFNQMSVDHTANPVHCLFEHNFITNANENSLNFTSTHCTISEVFFMEPCSCNLQWLEKLTTNNIKAESFCKIDSMLKPCFNTSLFNVLKYENEICDYSKTRVDCMKNKVVKKIEDNFIDPSDINDKTAHITLGYMLIGSIILLIIIIVIVVVAVKRLLKPRTLTIPVSEMNATTINGTLKNCKLFSNDDRVIINQTLENMKMKYPPEKYDQVHNYTKKLMEGNLTETEKVLTIGEIVRCLGECESTGEDFVAFTDILYKHLAPKDTNQNDPVYSEPILPRAESDLYNTPDSQMNQDHIYAEPQSVQQPLLKTEYSAPIDKNEFQTNFYSEPIVNILDKHHIISPYAIGNHLDTQTQLTNQHNPSTVNNLPDVLNRNELPIQAHSSGMFTSMSDFSSNPKYHITRSPITNRHIPKYTIPSASAKKKSENISLTHSPDNLSSSSSNSEHSGGSDTTCKIDDVIDYVDA